MLVSLVPKCVRCILPTRRYLSLGEAVYDGREKVGTWKNLDGFRIEDGRYAAFAKQLDTAGIPKQQIFTDSLRTFAYGTDASFYRLNPKVVVKVRNEDDVVAVLSAAAKHQTPVTFRAAGTSLSGQAVTDSVLVKLSHFGKSWRKYWVADDLLSIVLEPGLIGGEVNRILHAKAKKLGIPPRKIGPDPASIDSCMIGGIVSNNSSGMCCGVKGNSYHTVQDIRAIFVDGKVLDTADPRSVKEFLASSPELIETISNLAREVQGNETLKKRISQKFHIKCTTGYSLNALVDFSPDDPVEIIKHLLIGSEGTLAFISKVSYRTLPDHQHRASTFLMFPSMYEACRATAILKKGGHVDAAELFDKASLREGEKDEEFVRLVPRSKGCEDQCAGVLVECRGEDNGELDGKITKVWESLEDAGIEFLDGERAPFSKDPVVFNVLWDMRKGLIPKVGGAREKGTTMLIEDVACPIDSLADMTVDLIDMFKRHNYKDACVFGHALDGNLHLVFSQGFRSDADLEQYSAMMEDMCSIVATKYSGSLKGEHGTGRNVAPFVELEWGEQAYRIMWDIKNAFDPNNLLNPGVLLNRDPDVHRKSLKPMPNASDISDHCIECGFCESNCPSRDTTLTPRQRITVYREMQRLRETGSTDRLRVFNELFPYLGDQTCAADGMCQEKCPVGINTGELIKHIRTQEVDSSWGSSVARAMATHFNATTTVARGLLAAAKGTRAVLGTSIMGYATSLFHLAGRGYLPKWTTFLPGSAPSLPAPPVSEGPIVVYLPSCVTRIMASDTGVNNASHVVSILTKAGFTVRYPSNVHSLCCGMMFDSRGFQGAAALKRKEVEKALLEASGHGKHPIVCDNSPCWKTVRDGMESPLVRGAIYDPITFINNHASKLEWKKIKESITVHVPCSTKKGRGVPALVQAAGRCCNSVHDSGIPCCGMAGDRGLRYPELTQGSLRHLQQPADDCYSTSTTCEVGLSRESGVQWKSLVSLIDASTVPRSS